MKTAEVSKRFNADARIDIKNILYATDFSPVAEDAGQYALELARRYGSKIFALHVRPLQVYGMAPPESWAILAEATESQAKDEAEYLARMLKDVEHQAIVQEGDIWTIVSKLVQREKIDLIVIGTHGRKGFEKFLIGSVAENILRRSACPVLTVGPRVHYDPARGATVKHIVYATDFSPASEAAAPYAISLAQENQAHLALMHVMDKQKANEAVHAGDLLTSLLERMRGLVPPEARFWCEPNFLIEAGVPADQILNVAKARRADLIVLGVKPVDNNFSPAGHLPWSTAHRVVREAECPVFTVRG